MAASFCSLLLAAGMFACWGSDGATLWMKTDEKSVIRRGGVWARQGGGQSRGDVCPVQPVLLIMSLKCF